MARVASVVRAVTNTVRHPFTTDTTGLHDASRRETVDLAPGARFRLEAAPVRKQLGDASLRMLAYNGSIPGPTLRVEQGSTVTVDFINYAEVDTTIHWHGIRLDNDYDGVPYGRHRGMQAPIPMGGAFSYKLRFSDPGIYWYHPHVREDYAQELGLYGNILVTPIDPEYWAPANREEVVVLDDILLKGSRIAPFSQDESNRTAMGRYGNAMLVNGESEYRLSVERGEVVRFFLTNTANVRPFNVRIAGARIKLVGSDGGRLERESFLSEVLIAPSERAVIDVLFDTPGEFTVEHAGPEQGYRLGTVEVAASPVRESHARAFEILRTNPEFEIERDRLADDVAREPDKRLSLVAVMPGMKNHGGHAEHVDIEWEDNMALHNRMTTPENMFWKLVDAETRAENHEIEWAFRVDDRVKLRIVNESHSDHPMQHPFHIHGQRFLVIARDGQANEDLAWKDTVLIRTGETIDLLVEMTNPGVWMAHCHIAEHLEGGMMLSFEVRPSEARG